MRLLALVLVFASACSFDASVGFGVGGGGDVVDVAGIRLVFADESATSLSIWTRDSTGAWSESERTPALPGPARFVRSAVVGSVELVGAWIDGSPGQLVMLSRQSGGEWVEDWRLQVDSVPDGARPFDLIAATDGRGVLVSSDGDGTPSYRVWNDGWSAALEMPLTGTRFDWFELAASPVGMGIALAAGESDGQLHVIDFLDDSWQADSTRLLTSDLKRGVDGGVQSPSFDLEFRDGGGLVVCFGEGSESRHGARCRIRGPSMTGFFPLEFSRTPWGYVTGVSLASHPGRNWLAGGFFDLEENERLGAITWKNMAVEDGGELDSELRNDNDVRSGSIPGAAAWSGDIAAVVYADSEAQRLPWAQWTEAGGWSLPAAPERSNLGRLESVVGFTDSDSGDAVFAISDDSGSLFVESFDGSVWTTENGGPLSTELSTVPGAPFALHRISR